MSGFSCMECGHVFKTVRAAERASFGPDGCPKCGGSDIDETPVAARFPDVTKSGGNDDGKATMLAGLRAPGGHEVGGEGRQDGP